jgi:hypothetical protein
VYADSTAVVGPLATYAEPHCYDLCQMHSDRLTAPKGWEIVRITPDPDALKPSTDDLEALANAVREAAKPRYAANENGESVDDEGARSSGPRRGHLRVVPDVAHVVFPDNTDS